MSTPDPRWQPILDLLGRVKTAWPASSKCIRDDHFDYSLSTVDGPDAVKALPATAANLPSVWTPATVAGAPATMRELTKQTGGLRGTQKLYAGAGAPRAGLNPTNPPRDPTPERSPVSN